MVIGQMDEISSSGWVLRVVKVYQSTMHVQRLPSTDFHESHEVTDLGQMIRGRRKTSPSSGPRLARLARLASALVRTFSRFLNDGLYYSPTYNSCTRIKVVSKASET
jgi:hypothetical protein